MTLGSGYKPKQLAIVTDVENMWLSVAHLPNQV